MFGTIAESLAYLSDLPQSPKLKGEQRMTHGRNVISFTVILSIFFCLAANAGFAQSASSSSAAIANNTPGFIKQAKDLGPADPSAIISVTAWLRLHNENK